ncbi:tail fiber domain-containing protein [Candidatus Nomurabacteria bacterium]|nr:MAG: tail fiber domain-containing protein [Candidatus Nomurabacteria bacterium]
MKKFAYLFIAFIVFVPYLNTNAALTPGSVVFANPVGKNTGQDNLNFFWNDTLNYLGIGTNSPSSPLTVVGNTLTGSLGVGGVSGNYPFSYDALTSTLTLNDIGDAKNIRIKSDNENDLLFIDGVNDRIGVGLSNPTYEFEVANDGQNVEIVADTFSTSPTFTTKTVFGGRAARGTRISPLPVQNNDILAEFSGLGYGTTAFAPSTTAGMRVIAAETFSDSAWGTGLFFRTTGRGSVILQTRMVVDADGNVGIGDTTPETPLDVEKTGTLDVATFTNTSGTCSINPAVAGGITCTSDVNLKKNIESISSGESLDIIKNLRPVKYNWKNESDKENKTSGFIAQEVEAILPEVVVTENNQKRISMSGLIPYIVGSLTDLASRFEKIENEKITTPKIETELLCVGDTCLTEEEVIKLKILLEN